jgi:glycosyl transferase family 2
VDLLCHINDDSDLLQAWLDHYLALGVTRFHLVVHGPASDNKELYRLQPHYPIEIVDTYDGAFHDREKKARMQAALERLRGRWMVLVDSDELVELPHESLTATVDVLQRLGATALAAPMLQRLREDGGLDTPVVIADPFDEMPLCSPDLYATLGVDACIDKYPLFFNSDTVAVNGGNHLPPDGPRTVLSGLRGVTHHFKWRAPVLRRLRERADSTHTYRHESASYLAYLQAHDHRLPVAGAFRYSRSGMFTLGLLRGPRGRAWLRLRLGARRSSVGRPGRGPQGDR